MTPRGRRERVIDRTRRKLPPSTTSHQNPLRDDLGALALAIGAARPAFAPLAPTLGRVETEEVKKKRASDQRTSEENSQGKRAI
jgi:hypothetical protein